MKPPLRDPAFVLGAGGDTGGVWAARLDLLTGVTGIGTAVALYPVARRVSRARSLGLVTSRVIEAGTLVVGALAILAMVTLPQDSAGASGDVAASVRVSVRCCWPYTTGASHSAPDPWPSRTRCRSAR